MNSHKKKMFLEKLLFDGSSDATFDAKCGIELSKRLELKSIMAKSSSMDDDKSDKFACN